MPAINANTILKGIGALLALDGAAGMVETASNAWLGTKHMPAQDRIAFCAKEMARRPDDIAEAGLGATLMGINLKKQAGIK